MNAKEIEYVLYAFIDIEHQMKETIMKLYKKLQYEGINDEITHVQPPFVPKILLIYSRRLDVELMRTIRTAM